MCADRTGWVVLGDDGARLFVRVTPGAACNEIAGLWPKSDVGPDDEIRLSVKVTAPPDKGKANAAVIKLLAKALGVPKSSLAVASGETSRLKTLAVVGEPKVLQGQLDALIAKYESKS